MRGVRRLPTLVLKATHGTPHDARRFTGKAQAA